MNDDGFFDERIASTYDDDVEMFDPKVVDPVVDYLVDLVGVGRALEFGIGTGRIALPLAERGVAVSGIELSSAMVAKLEGKSRATDMEVAIGDFATTQIDGAFSVVYLVFNTIMNLTTQASQIACFRNAAAHLEPGGSFVVEVMMPRLHQLSSGESLAAYDVSDTHWGIDQYDVAEQGLISHHLRIVNGESERFSLPLRYVWPGELDLMAQLAGMTLSTRAGGWKGEPFDSHSASHVSSWTKP